MRRAASAPSAPPASRQSSRPRRPLFSHRRRRGGAAPSWASAGRTKTCVLKAGVMLSSGSVRQADAAVARRKVPGAMRPAMERSVV